MKKLILCIVACCSVLYGQKNWQLVLYTKNISKLQKSLIISQIKKKWDIEKEIALYSNFRKSPEGYYDKNIIVASCVFLHSYYCFSLYTTKIKKHFGETTQSLNPKCSTYIEKVSDFEKVIESVDKLQVLPIETKQIGIANNGKIEITTKASSCWLHVNETINIEIVNKSNQDVYNSEFVCNLPNYLEYIHINISGILIYKNDSKIIKCKIQKFTAGQKQIIRLVVRGEQPGDDVIKTRLIKDSKILAVTTQTLKVFPMWGMAVDIQSFPNPCEIGKDLTYTFKIKNTGTRSASHIISHIKTSKDLKFKSAEGINFQIKDDFIEVSMYPGPTPGSVNSFSMIYQTSNNEGVAKLQAQFTIEQAYFPGYTKEIATFLYK